MRNLERHVGARLLERSSRVVRPTAHGQALYEGSHEALITIDAALEGVRRDMGAIEGHLRLHAPTCIGAKHVHGIVMAFQRQHPAVAVDLILENRDIDLIYENFDLALRYGRPSGQNLIIRHLGWIERILVAAPAYLARCGPVEDLDQLSQAGVIVGARLPAPRDLLSLRHSNGDTMEVPVNPVLRTNSAEVIASTLVSGHAAGPVQRLLVADELADGRLIRILPAYEVKPTEAFLAYPSVRFMRPVVRAFTDFAVPALRAIEGLDVRHEAETSVADVVSESYVAPQLAEPMTPSMR